MDSHTHLIGLTSHTRFYLLLPVVVKLLLSKQDFSSHSVLSNLTLFCQICQQYVCLPHTLITRLHPDLCHLRSCMHNLDSLHSVVWLCDSWTLLWCTSALHDSFHSTLLEFFSH